MDAALDYAVNGPVQLRLAGQAETVMPVSDYMDLPSNGMITNDQTIRDHPELVQALVDATLHGLQRHAGRPRRGLCQPACGPCPKRAAPRTKVNRAIFDESLKLWQADPAALGVSDPAMWQQAATFMKQTGLIDQAVMPEDLYTNQFVAQANEW